MENAKITQGVDEDSKLLNSLYVKQEDVDMASRALKAISHPIRLKILCILGENEVSVLDIVEYVGTTQSNVSQHLAILRDKDILESRKEANRVFYRVGDAINIILQKMAKKVGGVFYLCI